MFKGKTILACVLLVVFMVAGSFQACSPGVLATSASSLSVPEPQVGHAVAQELPGAQPRLGDHGFMASSFTSIFGTNADVMAIVKNEIESHISIFGGRCDRYRGNCASDVTGEYIPALGSNSVLREAYKIRACDEILELPSHAGLSDALTQISGAQISSSPTDTTITSAYALFFPGLLIPEQNLIVYKWVVSRSTDPLTQWKLLLTVLCHDPNWEIP